MLSKAMIRRWIMCQIARLYGCCYLSRKKWFQGCYGAWIEQRYFSCEQWTYGNSGHYDYGVVAVLTAPFFFLMGTHTHTHTCSYSVKGGHSQGDAPRGASLFRLGKQRTSFQEGNSDLRFNWWRWLSDFMELAFRGDGSARSCSEHTLMQKILKKVLTL
jgi:hypothetical protein